MSRIAKCTNLKKKLHGANDHCGNDNVHGDDAHTNDKNAVK